MVSSNPGNLELKDLDNTFSTDVVKPFPENPNYISTISSSSYPTVLTENSAQSGTTIQLPKDDYNPPVLDIDNNNNKPSEPDPPSINQPEKSDPETKPPDMSENIISTAHASNDNNGLNEDYIKQSNECIVEIEDLGIIIHMDTDNKPEIMTDENDANDTYPASGKRKLDVDDMNENIKKKVHIENTGPSLFEDEEQDITSFIRILDDGEANTMQLEEPEDQSDLIGIKILPDVVEPKPEKQSASPPKKLSIINQQVKLSPDKIKDMQTEQKQTTDLISSNRNEKPDITVQESDGGFDLFGFDDGLGIKILDEVFLCQYCHTQIPQDGTGLKDICRKCQNKDSKGFHASEYKTILSETCVESESDFFSNSQPFPIRILNNDRPHIKQMEHGTSLRPETNIETQIGRESSDDEWVDILNHACYKDKLLCVGHKYQADIVPLGLYENRPRRDIRRLWNPSRVELPAFEKFRADVNARNATYLIDEEVAEILVRNECDISKALDFSIKANLDFQTYLKRSSNRRRMITKMTVR